MRDIFQIVKQYKKTNSSKPIILMGYYNMIFNYGENKFLKDCKKSNVSGIICVDLPGQKIKILQKNVKVNQ